MSGVPFSREGLGADSDLGHRTRVQRSEGLLRGLSRKSRVFSVRNNVFSL